MILYGAPLAEKILGEVKNKPLPVGKLVVIKVGDDLTSELYITKKSEVAQYLSIDFEVVRLEKKISVEEFRSTISRLNEDSSVRAILLQIPLPSQIDRNWAASLIDPSKDIDGFNYILGKSDRPIPPTIMAIVDLLGFYIIPLESKKTVIVGGGFLVGKPLYRYLYERGYQVMILEKNTPRYEQVLKSGDIVITATGRGGSFTRYDFKSGAVVIDASTVCESGATRGDVDLRSWNDDVSISPVPGGIGPVTVAELYKNFYLL
jgi:methylenetetrahydrofolate dehydrogenase (NADP+)/methenyltetrahydrofolate cyclohydrolase